MKTASLSNIKRLSLPKWLKISAIILGSLLVIFIATALVIQDRIKEMITKEINKQLVVKVAVDELSFSLIKNFPSARLSFTKIYVPSPDPATPALLKAERLSLNFSILDLLRKNYSIRYVEIRNGTLNIVVPPEGEPNYQIFKPGDGDDDGQVAFALKKVRIDNVDVRYQDPGNKLDFRAHSDQTVLRGDFASTEYRLSLAGNIQVERIMVGTDGFFSGQDAVIELKILMDNVRSVYTIQKGSLEMEGLPFNVDGWVEHHAKAKKLALKCVGNKLVIGQLLELIPAYRDELANDYLPEGEISITGTIEGSYAGDEVPVIRFDFGLEDGSVEHRQTGVKAEKMNAKGSYSYSSTSNDLSLDQFSVMVGTGSLSGSISLLDVIDPVIQMNLEGAMDLQELSGLFPNLPIQAQKGRVRVWFKGTSAASVTSSWSITHLLHSKTEGEVIIEDASSIGNEIFPEFSDFSGRFVFDNNDVKVTNLKGKIKRSDVLFSGYLRNLFPYLLLTDQQLEFTGTILSQLTDVRELLFSGGSATGSKSTSPAVKLPERIRGTVDVQIGQMHYGVFTPTEVRGRVTLAPGRLFAEQVSMRACGGQASGQVLLTGLSDGRFHFDAALQTDRTDIKQLFRQFSNFGQTDLTDKHLEGLLTSRIRIQSYLKPDLNFDLNSLEAIGELMAENGALLNYSPVQALAKYTRLDDLSTIRFNTLRNEIRISERKIVIPEMMIRSDAVDLSLAGTHSFDGEISYRIQMLLSELLSRKAKRSGNAIQDQEVAETDHRGRMTIHLLIEGTVDQPVVKYDRKMHRTSVKGDLRNEKGELKDLFKREFGIFSRDNQPNEKPTGKRNEEEIIIQWEDD